MNVVKMAGMAVATVLLTGGLVMGAHAPWPSDWNNWSDPALWVPVGNPGNAGELSGEGAGGYNPDRICGAVEYEYRIGKYEVTAGQYTEFLNKVAVTDAYGLYNTNMDTAVNSFGCDIKRTGSSGSYTYSVDPNWANRPVNYVSFWDACRFANWLHNGQPTGAQAPGTTERGTYTLDGYNGDDGRTIGRNTNWKWAVTSEDEWYKAAYHKNDGVTGNYWDYPTSSNTRPGRDMTEATKPGNNANYFSDSGGYVIGSPYYRTEVGEFENSESSYGTFDQGGNVWEWNESVVYGAGRGLRGGSFGIVSPYGGSLLASSRGVFTPSGEHPYLGFRVSEVPEPLSAAVLLVGGVFLSRRRARRA